MMLRQIMLAGVTNNKNYNRVLVQRACHTQRGGEIGAGGSTAEDPLQPAQHPRQLKRFTIGNVDYFIDILYMNVRRHDLLTDSLDEIRSRFNNLSCLFVSLENRSVRIGADD